MDPKLSEAIARRACPSPEGISEDLANRIATHNQSVAEIDERIRTNEGRVDRIASGEITTDEALNAWQTGDEIRVNRGCLFETVGQQWASKVDLCDAIIDELEPQAKPLDDAADAVYEEVAKALEEIGSGIASMVGYGAQNDAGVAEHQFAHIVRRNTRYRAAAELAQQAAGRVAAARSWREQSELAEQKFAAHVISLARAAAAGV